MKTFFKRTTLLLTTAGLALMIPSCSPPSGPAISDPAIQKIGVPPGPEDLVLDRKNGRNRLIVSCRNMREKRESRKGSLIAVNLDQETPTYEPLISTWKGKPLQPHGICLSDNHLYVVNHPDKGRWEVIRFRLNKEGQLVEPKSLGGSPVDGARKSDGNDLTILPNGDLVMSALKPLVKRHSRLLHYSKSTGTWRVLDPKPPGDYPNGVWADGSDFITSSIGGVHRYSQNKLPKTIMKRSGGGDNFGAIEGRPREVLLTSHQSTIRFGINSLFACFRSPSILTRIQLDSDTTTPVRLKSREQFPVNAGSVGIITEGHLWIGQVFGDYLLKIPRDRLEGL